MLSISSRLSLAFLGWGLLHSAAAQEPLPTSGGASPLGIRQQRVERMMDDLEQKFKTLKLAIQQQEPKQAERVQAALNKAKELLIQQRMANIGKLLDQSQLDAASEAQAAILADLSTLLAVLLQEGSTPDQARDELEQLEAWRKQIESLIQSEQNEQIESERLAKLDRSQLAKLPAEVLAQLARRQEELASEAKRIAETPRPLENPDAEQQRPGQQTLQRAQRAMRQAAGDLNQRDPHAANRQEADAIKELLEALKEVKERQEQVGEQRRSNTIAMLTALFQDMLARQQQLTKQTAALQAKRTANGGPLSRGERNAVRAIGDEQRRLKPGDVNEATREAGLAGQAQAALDLLQDDSASAALAATIEQLRDDLIAVGNVLVEELRTDSLVAQQQQNIETSLRELIDALQKNSLQQSASATGKGELPGQPGDSQGQKQGLVAAQGGKTGGGSQGTDGEATQRLHRGGPQSPWSQLRDKQRDPVYSAIQEKFPARYRQLIEQYYQSFQDDGK